MFVGPCGRKLLCIVLLCRRDGRGAGRSRPRPGGGAGGGDGSAVSGTALREHRQAGEGVHLGNKCVS